MNWQEAVIRIQENYDFEYPVAVDHYVALKKRMFAQIRMNSKLQQYQDAELGSLLTESLNRLYKNLDENPWELSSNSLERIQNYVIERMSGSDGAIIQEIQNEINRLESDIASDKMENTTKIKQLRNQLKILLNSQDSIETLLQEALKKYNPPDGSLSTIISFLETFMLNTVEWYIKAKGEIYINSKAITTLLGYYKEIIENKIVNQALIANNITNATVDLIANSNSINDLLIAFNNSGSETISITENIGILSPEEEQTLFGAQIKARDLEKVKTSFMKISHQAGLQEAFNAQLQTSGFNNKSWACGVAFLGQAQNILKALGKNNVLFISGPNHYFMDEFITKFRNEKMYLAFEKGDNNYVTSQIGLQRFLENRKSNSQNFLRKFR